MRLDNMKQGDRVQLTKDFYYGRFKKGHLGTVMSVSGWTGKNHDTATNLRDGDKTPFEFSPETSGALRPAADYWMLCPVCAQGRGTQPTVCTHDELDVLVDEIMDLAREHPIDDAAIYIRDRILKDAVKAIRRIEIRIEGDAYKEASRINAEEGSA